MEQGSISLRLERNLNERNRRRSMKDLYLRLASLIRPLQSSNTSRFSAGQLSVQATIYIKQLQERIEKLQRRKELLMGDENCTPVINMRTLESTLEINIICGSKRNFMLHQFISILEEEGAEVINTTYHNAGDRIFYTIYSQAISSRIGIETSRVHERLKRLIS